MITGALVFYFIYFLCAKLKKHKFLQTNAVWLASVTAGLFLLHPVQSQTVSYAIQARLEGLATCFSLITLLFFVLAAQTKNEWAKIALYTATFLFGSLSCGTKEIVIALPVLALITDWFFIAEGEWSSFKKRLLFHLAFTGVVFGTLLFYMRPAFFMKIFGLKYSIVNNRGNILTKSANDTIYPLSFLISEFKVLLHYLFVFLWPINMSVEYDWKLSPSFFAPDTFFSFLALMTIFGIAIHLFRKDKASPITFGLIWFFAVSAPRSTIIPSAELVCDYKTYMASPGWLFIIAMGIVYAVRWIVKQWDVKFISELTFPKVFPIFLLAFSMLGITTMQRNEVWRSTIAFWEDIIYKAPTKARARNNLGVALSEHERYEEAIPHYLEAIRLDRFYSDPWSNMAVAYSVRGNDDKAIAALQEATRLFPDYPEAYNNLGSLLMKKKEYEKSELCLTKAIALRPYYGKAWFNYGRLCFEQERMEEAWQHFKNATIGDLDVSEAFNILGQVSLKLEKYEEAAQAFDDALKRMGGNEVTAQIVFNRANAYFLLGKLDVACESYAQLSQAYPNVPKFSYNLAESLYSLGKFTESRQAYKQVLEHTKEFPVCHVRIAQSYEQEKDMSGGISYLTEVLAQELPDGGEEMLSKELKRLEVQAKINAPGGSIHLKDLQDLLGGDDKSNGGGKGMVTANRGARTVDVKELTLTGQAEAG